MERREVIVSECLGIALFSLDSLESKRTIFSSSYVIPPPPTRPVPSPVHHPFSLMRTRVPIVPAYPAPALRPYYGNHATTRGGRAAATRPPALPCLAKHAMLYAYSDTASAIIDPSHPSKWPGPRANLRICEKVIVDYYFLPNMCDYPIKPT